MDNKHTNNSGCNMPVMVGFSALMTAGMIYTGLIYDINVLLGFGIFQGLITILGIYAIIRNSRKPQTPPAETTSQKEISDETESK